ncbi:MAG: DUF1565 domain-containing protein [Pegethrix bostrychoides GSE-TBD4-15B]|jgi:parallel beta-helix repeat protein|uniref:DUF1565 domain-containing protein n=1 Tax=Pegethrix bostrychoides GSE-TBD4-15B TaxID=2839662 RepID=A0A951PDY3_9CYAN|nr:DUF1565 domain-containing protein [Pegethrix bostrychoides GSE-TBD4-15B]
MQFQMPVEIYVHPIQGDDAAAGDSLAPFKTLSHALQQAQPGTVIQLSRGSYSLETGEQFPLLIPAGVSVQGNLPGQGQGVTVTGSGSYDSAAFGSQSVTLLLQDDAELRGVTVSNPEPKGTGIWIESAAPTAPTVSGCTLSHCGREGILVTGQANPVIHNCQFLNNRAGLTLVRQARGEVRNNTTQHNQFGLVISDQAAPVVSNNQWVENRCGIMLSGSASPILRGNVIAQNSEDGLAVFGQAAPDLGQFNDPAANRLRDNQRFDLRNATALKLISLGNQLNPARTNGFVEFVSLEKPSRITAPQAVAESPPGLADSPALSHAPADLQSHWAARLVQPLIDRQISPLLPDGSFQPEADVTPSEFARWMQRAGLVAPMTLAAPASSEQPLTRLQTIEQLVAALHLPSAHPSLLQGYRDRVQIPSDQTLTVATALEHRLVVSTQPNDLNPLQSVTRAEAAAMLYQTLLTQAQVAPIDLPQILQPQRPVMRLQAKPAAALIVVLDPGHGGDDLGMSTAKPVPAALPELPMMPMMQTPEIGSREYFELASIAPGLSEPPRSSRIQPQLPMPLQPPPGMPVEELRLPGEPPEMPSLQEKHITLSVAQAVAGFLQQQGVEVLLTRSADQSCSLAERRAAAPPQAAAFVSFHANASLSSQPEINGIETYHHPDSREGGRLAWSIHKTLTRTPDVTDRGVRAAPFPLLALPLPAAQIEVGYITGSRDAVSLGNSAYHRYLGRAIANGILRFLRQRPEA